jgi:hypothetical protein
MNLTQDNIDNHFRTNRAWKALFEKYYKEYTPETYIKLAWDIFEKNGYRYEIERYSNRPESRMYHAVKCIDLFHGEEFIIGRGDVYDEWAVEALVIMVICDFEVDFSTFN